jgi:tRNA(fMet)-specific endonuclease VapC
MFVLDTDHVVEFQKGTSADALRLIKRIDDSSELFVTTIITVEEVSRGWLSEIRRTQDPLKQITAYRRFRESLEFFATLDVLDWDTPVAGLFLGFRQAKVRTGTMDLKIASICLTHQATLLTRNRVDFEKVPGLTFEDWLSP